MSILLLTALTAAAITCAAQAPDTLITPDNEHIYYMGRIDKSDPAAYRFTYPGTTAMFDFKGSSLKMEAKPGSGRFVVEIDSMQPLTVNFTATDSLITLAENMTDAHHKARITYAIEGYEFIPEFRGFHINHGGSMLANAHRPSMKIEFIGNSITCGYGIEDSIPSNDFSYDTENHTLTYAHLAGRALNADVNIVARSGIGIYRNFGGDRKGTDHTMPSEYDNTMLYRPEVKWDFTQFTPDIICINLGTNDTSLDNYDIAIYEREYRKFLARLRGLYPQAKIVLLTGSMLGGKALDDVKSVLDRIAADNDRVYRFDMSPQTGDLGYGAAYHPSAAQARKMADELIRYLRTSVITPTE